MLKSRFVNSVLTLLLDGDSEGLEVKGQKDYLSETEFEYTGAGVFVSFNHATGIEKYKSSKPNLVLNGVTIESPELTIAADATLHFKNGLVDSLEIWSKDGKYPKSELKQYRLKQAWDGSDGQEIES